MQQASSRVQENGEDNNRLHRNCCGCESSFNCSSSFTPLSSRKQILKRSSIYTTSTVFRSCCLFPTQCCALPSTHKTAHSILSTTRAVCAIARVLSGAQQCAGNKQRKALTPCNENSHLCPKTNFFTSVETAQFDQHHKCRRYSAVNCECSRFMYY